MEPVRTFSNHSGGLLPLSHLAGPLLSNILSSGLFFYSLHASAQPLHFTWAANKLREYIGNNSFSQFIEPGKKTLLADHITATLWAFSMSGKFRMNPVGPLESITMFGSRVAVGAYAGYRIYRAATDIKNLAINISLFVLNFLRLFESYPSIKMIRHIQEKFQEGVKNPQSFQFTQFFDSELASKGLTSIELFEGYNLAGFPQKITQAQSDILEGLKKSFAELSLKRKICQRKEDAINARFNLVFKDAKKILDSSSSDLLRRGYPLGGLNISSPSYIAAKIKRENFIKEAREFLAGKESVINELFQICLNNARAVSRASS